MLRFVLPFTLFGIVCCFQPYTFIALPTSYPQPCWDYFDNYFAGNYCLFPLFQQFVFVFFKLFEMLAMVYLVYKIRNVKEELNVRTELIWILAVTIIFTLFYAIPLLRQGDKQMFSGSSYLPFNRLFFSALLIKCYIRVLISFCFCYKMLHKEDFQQPPQEESLFTIMDFDLVIVSVLPSTYFERFLMEKQPEKLPYWRMMQLIKMMKGIEKELD